MGDPGADVVVQLYQVALVGVVGGNPIWRFVRYRTQDGHLFPLWYSHRLDVLDGLRHCNVGLVVENPYDGTGINKSVVAQGLQAATVPTVAQQKCLMMPVLPIGISPKVCSFSSPVLDSVVIYCPSVDRVDDLEKAGRVLLEVKCKASFGATTHWGLKITSQS